MIVLARLRDVRPVLAPLALTLAFSGTSAAGPAPPAAPARHQKVAPIDAASAKSTHGPFSVGDCSLCHERSDPKNPGPALKPINATCFSCHEDVQAFLATSKAKHNPAAAECTLCHNPHNATQKKLLIAGAPELCFGCHADIQKKATSARVKHGALNAAESCLACHNPHGSPVEKLLLKLPFDLCVACHSLDDTKDGKGTSLTNFKKLLSENAVQHAPVAQKDCSSCHEPHGSDHTRLLIAEYPPQFYAPFEPANYALCFTCHDSNMIASAETTTETRFRDGKRNLHFVHVNKKDRGRTCRACHEVHAAKQSFLVRERVPYGARNWMLPVGYKQSANGGTCDKTCHSAKTYVNAAVGK